MSEQELLEERDRLKAEVYRLKEKVNALIRENMELTERLEGSRGLA